MKYVSEFRDPALGRHLAEKIHATIDPKRGYYRFMEFCGGHTHALARHGIHNLLPQAIQMIHGPGCPVCVLPIGRIDMAIRLAVECNVSLCVYGDCMRLPASKGLTLQKAKGRGADIRMVYAVSDALDLAQAQPERQVVFWAIGFETTAPTTAAAIRDAHRSGLTNFSVLCCHVLTPPAIHRILEQVSDEPRAGLDGIVGPAHVSTIIGSDPYAVFAQRYGLPVVIAGFEPLDLMQAILLLIEQVNAGLARVDNEFSRAVTTAGNRKAQSLMNDVFVIRDQFEWRGLGTLEHSALALHPQFSAFDAETRFSLSYQPVDDHPACECAAVLQGLKSPRGCAIFGTACTPDHPIGACMVSSEGACAASFYAVEERYAVPPPSAPSSSSLST